jgi:hypothetical protein
VLWEVRVVAIRFIFVLFTLSLLLFPASTFAATLLSNINETNDKGSGISRSNIWTTFKFTAGTATTIESVTLDLDETEGNYINFQTQESGIIRIYSDSSGSPGSQVTGTIGYTSTNSGNGHTLYDDGNIVLSSAGDYWLALTCAGCGNIYFQETGSTDFTGVSGWETILDATSRTSSNNNGSTWNSPFSTITYGTIMMTISGVANAAPSMAAMDDATVAEGDTITMTGTCTDSDSADTLTITSSQTSGTTCGTVSGSPDSGTGGSVSSSATCTAPSVSSNDSLVFTLSCSDATATNNDTVTITVDAAPTAVPQSISTDEDTAKTITLSGTDPSDDTLTYTVVTQPAQGTLSGTAPNLTYTPNANFGGADSFTFKVNDGLQDSDNATISITVDSQNDAPIITLTSLGSGNALEISCDAIGNCKLPTVSTSDDDNDTVTYSWSKVSGPGAITVTSAGEIDRTNVKPPKRGTYILQLVASDGTTETTSDAVTTIIPNNAPLIERDEDIIITGAELRDSKYTLSKFQKDLDIASAFTDYDDDTLSYSWSLSIDNPDMAGFISTTSGSSKLRARIAGDITVTVSVDDGFGGITTEEIIISIPVPEVTDDDIVVTISDWSTSGNGKSSVTGTLTSPVWPVVLLNKSITATVGLSAASAAASQGLQGLQSAGVDTTTTNDTYTFTASDVPEGTDPSQLVIEVLTSVNGENVALSSKTASADTTTDTTTGTTLNANWGCSLNTSTHNPIYPLWMLWIISGLIAMIRRT